MRFPLVLALAASCSPAAANSAPTERIAVGQSVKAILDGVGGARTSLRRELFATTAGPVTIVLESLDFDAVLRVESVEGELLAEDDDSGVETDARLVIPLAAGRTYVLVATAKGGTGELELSVHAGERSAPTGPAASEEASAWRHAAAERAMARGDLEAAARHRDAEGKLLVARSELAAAREAFESLLQLTEMTGNRLGAAAAHGRLGSVHRDLGDLARARVHCEEFLSIARELGRRDLEAEALADLVALLWRMGEVTGAREVGLEQLALADELGDRQAAGRTLGILGHASAALGDLDGARRYHERLLAVALELGVAQWELAALGGLGNDAFFRGHYPEAREHFQRVLEIARELGNRGAEAMALGSLGSVCWSLGDYARARELYVEDLALEREVGNRVGEAIAIGNIGLVSESLGELEVAREHYEQWLALVREIGDGVGQSQALGSLGRVHHALGENERALELQTERLALARALGLKDEEAAAQANIGEILWELGQLEAAIEHQERALELAREIGNRAGVVAALGALASARLAAGESARAIELATAADELAVELGASGRRPSLTTTLARSWLALGELERAREAVEVTEELLWGMSATGLSIAEASGLRGQFFGLGQLAQDITAARLATVGADGRAEALRWGFASAGRWKGRALLEGIGEHRSGARSAEVIELTRLRRTALAERSDLLTRVSTAIHAKRPLSELEDLRALARAKLAEAQRLGARLKQLAARDAAAERAAEFDPEEVSDALLGPGELLIEYAAGLERLYAYVLGEHGLVFVDTGSLDEIDGERGRFLAAVGERERLAAPDEVARAGRALFERLLAPALAVAARAPERLVIVPGAQLASLPFEALVAETTVERPTGFDELRFALESFEISYGPSTPVLVELAGMAPGEGARPVLLLADPTYAPERTGVVATFDASPGRALPESVSLTRLPGTRTEALAISRALLGAVPTELTDLGRSGSYVQEALELHLGDEATRARLAGGLRRFSVLHFACHGYIDAELPQRTGIALAGETAGEGFFTIADALELDLDADLVVLSACQTAQGEPRSGEGVESLARAFLYAGARGVIASLWQVDDRAAAGTMEALYNAWLRDGLPPARALRQAKLVLRRGETGFGPTRGLPAGLAEPSASAEVGHPFFWAPFVHIGVGR